MMKVTQPPISVERCHALYKVQRYIPYSDKLSHNPANIIVFPQKNLAKWYKPSHSNDFNLLVVKDKEKIQRKIMLLLHEKTRMQI